MKKEVKIIAALFNGENKILLEKYSEGYRLPSGKILKGERIEAAYKRFILKDTGLTIEMLRTIYAFNFDDLETISIVFACIRLSKFKPAKELPEKYQWFTLKESKKLILHFPYREMVARAYSKY